MSTNKQKKPKKEKIPLSKDRKKELIYIGTIITLVTIIVVMFALKFSDKIFNKDETVKQSNDNGYYVAVDPYEIPNRPEEYIKNQVENEIILNDIHYRMNMPFATRSATVTSEYADVITNMTGIKDNILSVKYMSYIMSIPEVESRFDENNNVIYSDPITPNPFVMMLIECTSEGSSIDVLAELDDCLPRDLLGEENVLDDVFMVGVSHNKVVVIMMNSSSKQKIGISLNEVVENFKFYMNQYDGRYANNTPENIINQNN